MSLYLYFRIGLNNAALFVDDIGYAMDACIFPAHELLGAPGMVRLQSFMTLIAEQGKGEGVFFGKLLLFAWGIGTHPEDGHTLLLERLEFIPESLAFHDSARCIGLGEKPEDYLPAAIATE